MPAPQPMSLDQLRIASPCGAAWDEMTGDDRVRHCAHCNLNVYNIAGMSGREARALITNAQDGACVRMYRRPDGTVITRDCPIGLAAARRRLRRIATAAATLFAIVSAAITANALGRERTSGRTTLAALQPFAAIREKIFGAPAPPPILTVTRPTPRACMLGRVHAGQLQQPTPAGIQPRGAGAPASTSTTGP